MSRELDRDELENVKRFQEILNRCRNPRRVYEAMLTLAPIIREARTPQQRAAMIDTLTPMTAEMEVRE